MGYLVSYITQACFIELTNLGLASIKPVNLSIIL